jgi:Reverse transcriptase (RNA-dependent DNA polymerase).
VFDTVNRRKLIGKLESLIEYSDMTNLIANILVYNQVQINDGISQSGWINQTIGVLQGDPLSPLLFNVLTPRMSPPTSKKE